MAQVKRLVKTEKDLSPAPVMGMLKNFVSTKSTAGLLRDQKKTMDENIKKSGG